MSEEKTPAGRHRCDITSIFEGELEKFNCFQTNFFELHIVLVVLISQGCIYLFFADS